MSERGAACIAGNVDALLTDLDRLEALRAAIARAASDCGRDPAGIALTCVTKTIAAERLQPIITAGQRVFGENRVQEAERKWPALRATTPGIDLRLIGPLQSNKAQQAVELFDVIETVDRPKIASALADAIGKTGRAPKFLVQVNVGEEPQKAGVAPKDADAFIAQCRRDYGLPVDGLMCIPPDGVQASPYFALLGVIAKRNRLKTLSMGMSGDWPLALQLGATHIRVGSAIFGARQAVD